jgi:hypothetical protein
LQCRRHASFDFLLCFTPHAARALRIYQPFFGLVRPAPRNASACAVARSTAGHGKIFTSSGEVSGIFFFDEKKKNCFFFF